MQIAAQRYQMKWFGRALGQLHADAVRVAGGGIETDHGAAARWTADTFGLANLGARHGIMDGQLVTAAGPPVHFHRDVAAVPGSEQVVFLARLEFVEAVAAVMERPAPMPPCGVAGTGETEHIARPIAAADHLGQHS